MIEIPKNRRRAYLRNCRILAALSAVLALVYLKWLLFDARPENHYLYWILVVAEIFNIAQAAGFWVTISVQKWSDPKAPEFDFSYEKVDLFVTVYGEPLDVVERTVAAAAAIRHPRKWVWVLDDGRSDDVKALAQRHGASYLTRDTRAGAKAGNLNHALLVARGDFFAIFDADQAPHPDFLERTMGAFREDAVAFVQTPQVYRNRFSNRVAAGAHDQQALFYGPILRGKNGSNAVFSCGTNVVYRRSAIDAIGGVPEDSITEDLRGSLLLLRHGYHATYISSVLADGLGPLDVNSYFNQQYRWARGGLEILLKKHPFRGKMSLGQRFQYGLGFLYWFTGWAYVLYLVLPVTFLFGQLRPIQVPNDYPVHFLPYVLCALATITYAADFTVSFDALWFTLASFPVQIKAFASTLVGGSAKFVVTPKSSRGAVSLRPVWAHIVITIVIASAAVYGLLTYGPTPSVVNNVAWIVAHIIILQGFVYLSFRPERSAAVAVEEILLERDEYAQRREYASERLDAEEPTSSR